MEQTKECSKCGVVKDVSAFNKRMDNKSGIRDECKICRAEYRRGYYVKNREKVRVAHTEYRAKNKEKLRECNKKYNAKNKEKMQKYNAEYRIENRGKLNTYYAKNRESRLASNREYNAKNPEKLRERNLRIKYGITIAHVKELLKQQLNRCAICGVPIDEKNLNVDHCHGSGKVRGLLCRFCNLGLGKLKDNIEFLYNAIEYLKTSRLDGRGDKTIQGVHYHEASFWNN